MEAICILCRTVVKKNSGTRINDIIRTKYSEEGLLTFLMDLFEASKENLHKNILCSSCLLTVNELDNVKQKSKDLTKVLLSFWENREADTNILVKDENIIQYEIEIKADPETEAAVNLIPQMEEHSMEPGTVETLTSKQKNKPKASQSYDCNECGKQFKNKKLLKKHTESHDGFKPHICIICNKSFTQKISLIRHMPLHTDDFPFQCETCGKRFKHHTSLSIHKITHTGNKNYKCLFCEAAFMSSSHLKRHVKVHTGEKRYVCSVCGKKFAEKYNLVSHEKIHMKL